ncbi:MFS transporter [Acinetobacter sp. ACZLY 512]|uniref:MFS transporter n=1 Tax=Acinetobacter sp. ACZLY 512 TaxID=2911206 RepID=UPI002026415E|nr:MFS transporter [Acinetobacter sp. ACZLY 512]MCL9677602.1 MFS transporter [Acinetobacter sp. ACZLY 512]
MRSCSFYTPTLILMAIAAGICSGSNYFSQPLIHSIALSLALPETSVAWIPTCAQISYAIGLLVLMPLGDLLEKRQLVVILMVLAACGLLITGSADRLGWMIVGTILTGLFSVSAQLLLPLAASLVPITQSGRVVGFLISALMLGILLARSLSGLASTLWDWQIIYVISGIALLMIAFMLYRKLDVFPATQRQSYMQTLVSIPVLLKNSPCLARRAALGFLIFASVSMVFTTMSLLLAPAPYHFSDFSIGLFGFVGILGTLIANLAGHHLNERNVHWISYISAGGFIGSWILFLFLPVSFIFYILATLLIYASLSALHVTNQSIVFRLNQVLKSRFNAIYMTAYFFGGALGTAVGSYAWRHSGWHGVCLIGIGFGGLTLWIAYLDSKSTLLSKQA